MKFPHRLSFAFVALFVAVASLRPAGAAEAGLPAGARRILFLGDSITFGGGYVTAIELYFRLREPQTAREFLNLGLGSETVSGLSEDGHAGGKFPRPDLHERLARVLARTKPDVVLACYGMNDGIYLPLAEERFAAYRRGIERLRAAVGATGAHLIHVTPPVFDEAHGKHPGYAAVLATYAAWLVQQRQAGWQVIDLNTAMTQAIAARRGSEPKFTFSPDSVHPNAEGHWLMARTILRGLGKRDVETLASTEALAATHPRGRDVLQRVSARQEVLKLAWLSATGHTRPGVKAGLPLAEAEAKAAVLQSEIDALLAR
jgi:lysophospholipase L1-like esterase